MSRKMNRVPQPFKKDEVLRNIHLIDAQAHVEKAIAELNEAMKSAEHWADYETMVHYRSQLSEFLSSDGGECGFDPYVNVCFEKTAIPE